MAETYELIFSVKEIRQTTGAYEHIVIFDAHLLLTHGEPLVEVSFVGPYDSCVGVTASEAEQWTLESVESIRQAVIEVLAPCGFGAVCEISKLRLHPIDFHPRFFKRYMIDHLNKALLGAGLSPTANGGGLG